MEAKKIIGNYLCRNAELRTWAGDVDLLCEFCASQAKCEAIKKSIEFFELKSEVQYEKAA